MIELNNKQLCESCFEETDSDVCPKCGFSKSEFTPDPLVLPMGTRLGGNIVIGRVMGKGGFGVTYLGYDLRMNKIIAVKEYYPNGIAYRSPAGTEVSLADTKSSETFDNGAEKFYAEAEMVAQFNGNPNIVSVYDYFRENNTVYLVMEYISGITLKSYVKKHGRLTDGQALYVMDKIAAALSITHSAGVLHRDISPDNIMVCTDGKIKLIDFGAARQIVAESSSNLTVVMKPGYTPVEQYTKKGRQGAWTDIYSLGVSVYYALTGIIIDDPYARMEDDSELEENKHGINDDLWAILKKCTMINAPDRYGSAIDLRKALKSVSAPIRLQPLSLDEDDLKIEEDTAVAPDIISENVSEENDFPVTAASNNDDDTAAVIETFEESTAVLGDNVKETAALVKSPDNKKKGKNVIGGICTAAVIIIGIISVSLAGGSFRENEIAAPDNPETSAAVTETESVPDRDEPTVTAVPEQNEETTTAVPTAVQADVTTAAPAETTAKSTTAAPKTTTAAPKTTTAAPKATTAAPKATTTAPKATTAAPKTTAKVTTTEPEKIEKPLYVPFYSNYYRSWYQDEIHAIKKSVLLKYFPGGVKVVLDIECVDVDKEDDGSYWHGIHVIDRDCNTVNSYGINTGINLWNDYSISKDQTKFSFTLERTDIEKAVEHIKFGTTNVIVKGASVYDYDPDEFKINPKAKVIQLDSKYPGSWGWSSPIPKKELESFKGDVKVTLSIEHFKKDGNSIDVNGKAMKQYPVFISPVALLNDFSGGTDVATKAENALHDYDNAPYYLGDINIPDHFTFVISSSEISKLNDEGGLCFACNNVIVKSAALEKA